MTQQKMQGEERYEIEGLIASGGYAKVYMVRCQGSDERHALKVEKEDNYSEGFAKSVLREVAALSSLSHPNIIGLRAILDFDEARLGLVLELAWKTLHQAFCDGDPMPVREYARQLLAAVDHCHARGFRHRDIKPDNVLIMADGTLRLADFGRAVTCAPNTYSKEDFQVCPIFAAPELLLKLKSGPAADVWSAAYLVGCIFMRRDYFFRRCVDTRPEAVEAMFEWLQVPSESDWPEFLCGYQTEYPELACKSFLSRGLSNLVSNPPDHLLNFLERLIKVNPAARLTARQALKHPYLSF